MVTIKKTLLILIVVSGTLLLHTTLLKTDEKPVVTSINSQTKNDVDQIEVKDTILDVPLENQFEGDIPLENGCEITALSMLLQYYGFQTNKNDLADKLAYVPVYEDEENNIHGDPQEGFVGNIYEGYMAMGAFVEPIADVASEIVQNEYQVVQSRKADFEALLQQVKTGTPVWIVSMVDFAVPSEDDFMLWQTKSGSVSVTALCHAVVITGVSETNVYVNNPYGEKNEEINRDVLKSIYEKMGSQSLYLVQKN